MKTPVIFLLLTSVTFAAEDKTHARINRELGLPDDKPAKAMFEFLKGLLAKH